jgi:hypothetical protein
MSFKGKNMRQLCHTGNYTSIMNEREREREKGRKKQKGERDHKKVYVCS